MSGTCSGSNNLTMLFNGLTRRNTVIGGTNILPRVLIRHNPTIVFRDRRRTYTNVLTSGIGTKSIIILHGRNPGNNPNVRRVLTPADCVVNGNLNGYITLVASNHFSNTARNTYVNRISPRTTRNNLVNLLGSNSVVSVSVPTHDVGIRLSSRRVTTHHTG